MNVAPGRSHATMPRFRPKAVDGALVTGGWRMIEERRRLTRSW